MPDGKYEIDEDTFKGMTAKQRDWILFATFNSYRVSIDGRLKKVESRKIVNTIASGVGGFFGGIIAMIGKWKIMGG